MITETKRQPMTMQETKYYKIGQIARELDISVESIRFYEREGIIVPHKTNSGQRGYDEKDKKWLNCIKNLINGQKLNVEGIRRLLGIISFWKMKTVSEKETALCPVSDCIKKPCWMLKDTMDLPCDGKCRVCHIYHETTSCNYLQDVVNQNAQKQRQVVKL